MKVAVQTATSVHHFRAMKATYTGRMEQTLDVSNAVAAELAGISDGVLDALKERLDCTVRLRGNQLTLEGDEQHVADARAVIDELVELVEGGHQIGVAHRRRRARHARGRPGRARGVRRRRLAAPRQEDRAEDGDAEALRRLDPPLDRHLRHRPGRHRQDVPRDGARGRGAARARGRADHPHAPRRRGGRAARLPAGRPDGEGRPVPAPAVRRALRHARPRQGERATWSAARSRSRRSPSCAAGR